jgi:hypothetical protein
MTGHHCYNIIMHVHPKHNKFPENSNILYYTYFSRYAPRTYTSPRVAYVMRAGISSRFVFWKYSSG